MKFSLIILAYFRVAEKGTSESDYAALQPVRGKPMLDWIVDMAHTCKKVSTISIIGPPVLDSLLCMRYVEKRFAPAAASLDAIRQVLVGTAPAAGITEQVSDQDAFVIMPCDAILIQPQAFEQVLADFEKSSAEVAIPAVSLQTVAQLSQEPVPDISIVNLDHRTLVAGVLAISRGISGIGNAIQRLNAYAPQGRMLRDSGLVLGLTTAVQERIAAPQEERFEFLEETDPALAVRVTGNLFSVAEKILPAPYNPPFPNAKIIINPQSGKGFHPPRLLGKFLGVRERSIDRQKATTDFAATIISYLSGFGIHCEVLSTRSAEDAVAKARACADAKCPLVIAAGGDGTVNSVINGLAGSSTALAVIPLGTVNVFALQLGIPADIRAACQVIAEGSVRTIDLGKANNRYFSGLAGIGYDAYVIQQADSHLKKVLGVIAYPLEGLLNLIRYPFKSIRLAIDNQPIPRKGYLVIVANGKNYGNMVIAPQAELDDGLLDVLVFKSRNFLSLIRYVWRLRKGNLPDLANVEYYKAKNVSVLRHGRHFIHTDGEYLGKTPVEITIAPRVLKVVCAANADQHGGTSD